MADMAQVNGNAVRIFVASVNGSLKAIDARKAHQLCCSGTIYKSAKSFATALLYMPSRNSKSTNAFARAQNAGEMLADIGAYPLDISPIVNGAGINDGDVIVVEKKDVTASQPLGKRVTVVAQVFDGDSQLKIAQTGGRAILMENLIDFKDVEVLVGR